MHQRPGPPSPNLLSPTPRDEDVASLRSLSEQESDSEDDEVLRAARSTLEIARHDRTVLEEEEETEKLLVRKQSPAAKLRRIFSPSLGPVRIGKKERRRRRGEAEAFGYPRGSNGPYREGDLMFEMEEGVGDEDSDVSSLSSAVADSKEFDDWQYRRSLDRHRWIRLSLVFSAIIILFLLLLLGAYKASNTGGIHRGGEKVLLSNGTALFAPTTILISLDGFRADYLDRHLTPTLNSLVAQGVSPPYMTPSFPSITFPNHYTLVTGLYPESHGVVANDFWDPDLNEEFKIRPEVVTDAKWYQAEPLWNTAEKQGVRSAIHMWPGSEAHIGNMDPTFWSTFNGSEPLPKKVSKVLGYLDLPGEESEPDVEKLRPQFIALYVPDVDRAGHKFGPNSTEIRKVISDADKMVADILEGLESRNLTNIVNIVVVSDHGMATTSTKRTIQLEEMVDLDLIEHIDGWPLRGLRPKRPEDLRIIKQQLAERAKNFSHGVEVYSREAMPARYHFSNNDRIAPVWVIPKAGWAVVERPDFDVKEALEKNIVYRPRGIHGYDNEHPLMRAIFIARGPAFPHAPNSRLEAFQNIEVYNIICDTLGVTPLPNNGTLRLPLKPIGLHDNESSSKIEHPDVAPSTTMSPSRPVPERPSPKGEADGKQANSSQSLWEKFKHTLESLKKWAGQLLKSKQGSRPS